LTGTKLPLQGVAIREARPGDEERILDWICRLAKFENLSEQVKATREGIARDFFSRRLANALFALVDGKPAGFAVWYFNYSTFAGKKGLFLEDIFVDEPFRGKGVATTIFSWLETKAQEEGCARIEWHVLDWNATAKSFYRSCGGAPNEGWEVYRKELP
jgi:GNAT superfamily N-acetyltransferase